MGYGYFYYQYCKLTMWTIWTLPQVNTALKGLAHAKIIKKSVILFWLLNMTIWCKHVHRLELQKYFNLCAAHSSVRLDIETEFPISNYWQPCQKYEIREFYSRIHSYHQTNKAILFVSLNSRQEGRLYAVEQRWPITRGWKLISLHLIVHI